MFCSLQAKADILKWKARYQETLQSLDSAMADRICVLEAWLVLIRGCSGGFKKGKMHSTAGEN